MILEIFIILCTLFFVSVWLYKQRRENIELLQLEFSNSAASLHDLVEEQQPIILRGVPIPPSLTQERLAQIPRLNSFPLRGSQGSPTLADYRANPAAVLPGEQTYGIPLLSREAARTLAKELALDTWANYTLRDVLGDFMGLLAPMYSVRTSVTLGGIGLRRPAAIYTLIMPIEGTYIISLVNQRSEAFLPTHWKYRYTQSLTVNDTPLVGEIQFIDVVVRPGTMVAIPKHCLMSMQPKEAGKFNSAIVVELHSPVSALAAVLDSWDDPQPVTTG